MNVFSRLLAISALGTAVVSVAGGWNLGDRALRMARLPLPWSGASTISSPQSCGPTLSAEWS